MLEKITDLRKKSSNPKVQAICEEALGNLSTIIYNNVSGEAKVEIEKATMENLFNQLSKIEGDDGVQTWVANGKRVFTLQNLGVRESINKLSESLGKVDPDLNQRLFEFKEKLNDEPEVLLYEEFISGMQAFSYYPEVGSAVDAIAGRVNSYKNDVDLTKILETMKKTRSSYLIPYIQTYIDNYISSKTEQNKSILKEALIKFSYDPFVRDIISVVTIDATSLQLEFANAECDIEKIYSPVIYLGENEAVFNVRGVYYVKKGNYINRLLKEDVKKLDPEYVYLCESINNPNIEIIGEDVNVYIGNDSAVINSKSVTVNGAKFGSAEFKRMHEASAFVGNGHFLNTVMAIKKNINEIAEIDFVKRVFLKENEGYSADIFKLRDNLFISTHNPAEGKSTFYRNINPIQAKNIMMEHLRFDVSRLFESLLPQEEKIKEEIDETKKNYVDFIRLLEGKIETFKHQTINKVTKEVISALEEELKEVRTEYKDYLNMVERYLVAPDDVRVSDLSEEIKLTIDVHGQKYVVPIPDGTGNAATTATGASDDLQAAGTVPGKEEMDQQPASAITFDDNETELLGDSPSIQDDEVDLGSKEAEEEADDKEEETEEETEEAKDKEDEEEDSEDFEEEGDSDLDLEDEEEEDEDQEEGAKKKEKNESLEKDNFVEDEKEKKIQPKVFLKKKKK